MILCSKLAFNLPRGSFLLIVVLKKSPLDKVHIDDYLNASLIFAMEHSSNKAHMVVDKSAFESGLGPQLNKQKLKLLGRNTDFDFAA